MKMRWGMVGQFGTKFQFSMPIYQPNTSKFGLSTFFIFRCPTYIWQQLGFQRLAECGIINF